MSFLRRHRHLDAEDDTDEDNDIDPDLRLRTVRTAASTIAESYRSEARRNQRRKRNVKRKGTGRSFFGRDRRKPDDSEEPPPEVPKVVGGQRRNIYVNVPLPPSELDQHGEPVARYARNKVRTSSTSTAPFVSRPTELTPDFRIYHRYVPSQKLERTIPTVRTRNPPNALIH